MQIHLKIPINHLMMPWSLGLQCHYPREEPEFVGWNVGTGYSIGIATPSAQQRVALMMKVLLNTNHNVLRKRCSIESVDGMVGEELQMIILKSGNVGIRVESRHLVSRTISVRSGMLYSIECKMGESFNLWSSCYRRGTSVNDQSISLPEVPPPGLRGYVMSEFCCQSNSYGLRSLSPL